MIRTTPYGSWSFFTVWLVTAEQNRSSLMMLQQFSEWFGEPLVNLEKTRQFTR
jgi:hypothetical protein